MNTCEHVREALPAYVVGEGDDPDVATHLEGCPTCRQEQQSLASRVDHLRERLGALEASAELEASVLGVAGTTPRRVGREPRTLSWTVAIGALAAVVAAAFILPHWLSRTSPVEPQKTAPMRSPADLRAARGDAPLFFHLVFSGDGTVTLFRTVGGESLVWMREGAWTVSLDPPEASMAALKGLYLAWGKALKDAGPEEAQRVAEGASGARLILDPDPGTPWRLVQWAIATACSPKLRICHLTFLDGGRGRSLDVDLPRDSVEHPEDRPQEGQRQIEARFFRRGLEPASAAPWTRVRLTAPPTPDAPDGTIDLPPGGASTDPQAEAWQTIEARLRALSEGASGVWAEIKAPFPTGGLVPYGDVVGVIGLLHAMGCSPIWLEGGAPPVRASHGGGWDFDDK